MKMKKNRSRRKLAALAAMVTATGGLLMIASAAHADGTYLCDPGHQSQRDPINRCDVAAVYACANWVDHWS